MCDTESIEGGINRMFLRKNLNASIDLLSIPQSGGRMSRRLGGIIGCKDKTS